MFAGLKQKIGEGLGQTAARSLQLPGKPAAVGNGLLDNRMTPQNCHITYISRN